MMRHLASVVVATLIAGCGLSVTGTMAVGDDAGASSDGAAPNAPPAPPGTSDDGGADGGVDSGPPLPACPPTSCGYDVPAGWSVVAYGAATTACPSGFTTSDLLESPTAQAGACSCTGAACTVTTQPNCNIGSITSTYGSTSSCSNNGAVNNFANGACQMVSNSFGSFSGFPAAPPPGAPGACTAPAAVADATKVTTTAVRACVAGTCAAACDSTVPAGLAACLATDGDQACPPGAPTKHLVGTTTTLTCGACSACTVSATGCTGSMTFYGNSDCTSPVKTIASNSCVNASGASFKSYKWSGTAQGVTCAAGGTATSAASLGGVRTICCR